MNCYKIVSQEQIDQLLDGVDKAARYTGGEVNSIVKEDGVACRIALAFPDMYEVAESHLGYKILYDVVNQRKEFAAERVYAMWPDLETKARQAGVPLWSLETHRPLRMFDLVGFSLQYELSYPTLVAMIEHGGIPVYASERSAEDPFVIGGGAGAFNPEPIAPFFDAFLLGDGEEAILEIMDTVRTCNERGASRSDTLIELARIPGMYVPSHFEITYNGIDIETIEAIDATPAAGTLSKHKTPRVPRRTVLDLDAAPYPTKPIIPNVKPVHDRVSVEVQRGCSQACRFCQAGMITRPTRQRKPETVLKLADESLKNTGCGEVGLMSLSIGDYEPVNHVLSEFFNKYEDQGLSVSLPSMRTETMTPELARQVARVRKSGFTFAPEAGSERMRRVINKTNSEEDLMNAVRATVTAGWSHLKFYFMIGLPTETFADVDAIAHVAERARAVGRQIRSHINVTVSVSTFVPKPHTSFQWDSQIGIEQTKEKQEYLRQRLRKQKIGFRYHSAEQSFLEGVFSRGDRRLAPAIEKAALAGCRLDAWSEHHDHQKWMDILYDQLASYNLKPDDYLAERTESKLLPWDHLDAGILKKFLLRDRKASLKEATIEDCALKDYCYACGGCDLGDPYLRPDPKTKKRTVALRPVVHGTAGLPIVDTPSVDLENLQSKQKIADPNSRTRLRYRYAKLGRGTHISHLDLLENIQRSIRMAELPVVTSQGIRPRMKLGFGPACPTGIESEAEYFDVFCHGDIVPQDYAESLNRWLPEGLAIINFDTVPWKAPAINSSLISSTYSVSWSGIALSDLENALEEVRNCDQKLVKVMRKGKPRILDAKNHILDLAMVGTTFQIKLGFAQAGSLKIREAVAVILGLEAAKEARIRKLATEMGDVDNLVKIPSVALEDSPAVNDITEVSLRRKPKIDVLIRSRPDSVVVPYAE